MRKLKEWLSGLFRRRREECKDPSGCCMTCARLKTENDPDSCVDAYIFVGVSKWPYVGCHKYKPMKEEA